MRKIKKRRMGINEMKVTITLYFNCLLYSVTVHSKLKCHMLADIIDLFEVNMSHLLEECTGFHAQLHALLISYLSFILSYVHSELRLHLLDIICGLNSCVYVILKPLLCFHLLEISAKWIAVM